MSDDLIAQASAGWVRAHELSGRIRELEAETARLQAEAARAWEHANTLDAALQAHAASAGGATYHADSLTVRNRVAPFLTDTRFMAAYKIGMDSGHHIGRPKGSDADLHLEWRVHILCWAAQHASKLAGDFVECGVNTGIYSLAVCQYVNFNRLDRDFWLFDTYCGAPESQMADDERDERISDNAAIYSECYELARSNFAPYLRAHLVRGIVPETLTSVEIERVAYLSLDMGLAIPERAAVEHFWPKLVPGAVAILNGYAAMPRQRPRAALDDFVREAGVEILTLPTGQGMLIKP